MKNFYYAVDVMRDGKHYPYVISISEGANLLANINRQETDVIHPCRTRKEAFEIIKKWRRDFQINGTLDKLLTDLF